MLNVFTISCFLYPCLPDKQKLSKSDTLTHNNRLLTFCHKRNSSNRCGVSNHLRHTESQTLKGLRSKACHEKKIGRKEDRFAQSDARRPSTSERASDSVRLSLSDYRSQHENPNRQLVVSRVGPGSSKPVQVLGQPMKPVPLNLYHSVLDVNPLNVSLPDSTLLVNSYSVT